MEGIKWLKNPKSLEYYNDNNNINVDDYNDNINNINDNDPDINNDDNVIENIKSKSRKQQQIQKQKQQQIQQQKQQQRLRKYYYELDNLAIKIPSTLKTKIYVTVGNLDIKTPLLEARKLLSKIEAPFKILFELNNVAHSTDLCRKEIIRAFISENGNGNGNESENHLLERAKECVKELKNQRKLDWEFENLKNFDARDWIL